MNPILEYKTHTPEKSDGFYHADSPHLYAEHDTITALTDCPFPLVTDSFRVLSFGTVKSRPEDAEKGYGHSRTFAVVEYVKTCGHLARERIQFAEGVKDFDHYGTKFTGASYSIQDWKNRIEFFRNTPCEVCGMIRHAVWIFEIGQGVNSRRLAEKKCVFLLDANYTNWREIVPESEITKQFSVARRRSK